MLEKEKDVLKLQDFLKKKNPHLRKEELDKISNQLYNLASFFVRMKIKQHLNQSKTHKDVVYKDEAGEVS